MIEIVTTGPFNTVQDLGRHGFRNIGVSASGAMDPMAVRVGNLLLGNDEGAAAIEVQTFPFALRFSGATHFVVAGADGAPSLNGRAVPGWCAQLAEAGQVLELRQPPALARAYVLVAGGIDVPVLMGSRSTALRGGFGGHAGRPLAVGDMLPIGGACDGLPFPPQGIAAVEPAVALSGFFPAAVDGLLSVRAVPAGEHDLFAGDGEAFWNQTWKISSRSDRTGYRLTGEPIRPTTAVEMRSHGVVPGVVQVPPGGEPIIQMSDANTAGGYPKIAGVIECDLWRLGQARPGTSVRFLRASHAEARAVEEAVARYAEDLGQTVRLVKRALSVMA
jgi:biotin-dependent carboxylase-like uncharacterized protein